MQKLKKRQQKHLKSFVYGRIVSARKDTRIMLGNDKKVSAWERYTTHKKIQKQLRTIHKKKFLLALF